jgi:hypothetical protein
MIFLEKPTWRSGCIGAFLLLMLNNSHAQSVIQTSVMDSTKLTTSAPSVIQTDVPQVVEVTTKTVPVTPTAKTEVEKVTVEKAKTAETVVKTTTDSTAKALPASSKMSLGVSAGTNALFGVDLAYKVLPRVALRLGYNYFTTNVAGIDIANYNLLSIPKGKTAMDITVDQSNIQLLADVSLTKKGGIRLTVGGAYGAKNEYTGKLRYKGTVVLNDIILTPEEMGYLKIVYTTKSPITPYVGLGLGRIVPKRRLNISLDLGTYYRGSPVIKVEATNLLKRNVENEEVLNRNLAAFKWYPVANLRLAFKLK